MSYRKLKADFLFDGFTMLSDTVLICDHDGVIDSVVAEGSFDGDIEYFQGIICPGFINCHCHLELSHLRGTIPQGLGLVNFVLSVISGRNQDLLVRQDAIRRAEDEMYADGIVAVGDICNSDDTLFQKQKEKINYYNFIELLGWSPERARISFHNGQKIQERFIQFLNDETHTVLCPHAPYSVSDDLWTLMSRGFKGKTVSIHNQESDAENEFFLSGTGDFNRMYKSMNINQDHYHPPGRRSLSHILPKLNGADTVLLVHNTFTSEADVSEGLSSSANLFYCLCPNANIYIENKLPDIPMFIAKNVSMVIGTDSLASNHQLSIMSEIKTIKMHYPAIPTTLMLKWATSNGADLLNFKLLGSFQKGKKPGIVLIDEISGGEITSQSRSRKLL